MAISFSNSSGVLTARFTGEIDHQVARSMMLALDGQVARDTPRRLVVDMSEVTFMDSSGIAVLLRAWRRMTAAGGGMEVLAVPPQPFKVFHTAGLDKIIPMQG